MMVVRPTTAKAQSNISPTHPTGTVYYRSNNGVAGSLSNWSTCSWYTPHT